MNRSQLIFFFAVLVVVIVIARYNSRSPALTQTSAPSPPPSSALVPSSPAVPATTAAGPAVTPAQLSQNQFAQFRTVAAQVAPAVILISVFDSSGKLLRNGTGFFVSEDGKVITSQAVVAGGANAVAKSSDGRIHNVSGIVGTGGTLDLVVLKAEAKKPVAFLSLRKTATDEGAPIAVIGNPLTGRNPLLGEGRISKKQSDQNGESFELSIPIPNELGSPAVNEKGEIVGVVTQGAPGAKGNSVRSAAALNVVLAQIDSEAKVGWQVALRDSPPPPAEGPSARQTKIPLADPQRTSNSRLIYSPRPAYPKMSSHSSRPMKGSGRFRVRFARNGEVKDVGVIESTRDPLLDNAAVDALRRWKAQPGQEWTASVPVTFQQ